MKKIIIYISILIIGITTSIILIISFSNKSTKLQITSYDEEVNIDFGKYKVKNYKSDKYDGSNPRISFKVDDAKNFYNKVIKENEYFLEELTIKTTDFYVYGYMVKENRLFSYSIKEDNVEICSKEGGYDKYKNTYFIFAPLFPALNDRLLTDLDDDYYQYVMDDYMTFNFFKNLIIKMDSSLYKIEGDCVYLKGLSGMDLIYDKYVISTNYLLKFYQSVSKIKVEIIEEEE